MCVTFFMDILYIIYEKYRKNLNLGLKFEIYNTIIINVFWINAKQTFVNICKLGLVDWLICF